MHEIPVWKQQTKTCIISHQCLVLWMQQFFSVGPIFFPSGKICLAFYDTKTLQQRELWFFAGAEKYTLPALPWWTITMTIDERKNYDFITLCFAAGLKIDYETETRLLNLMGITRYWITNNDITKRMLLNFKALVCGYICGKSHDTSNRA